MKIKSFLALILAGAILLSSCASNNEIVSSDETSSEVAESSQSTDSEKAMGEPTVLNGHTIRRGINVKSYRGENHGSNDYLVDEFTYQNISERGFDHIRLTADLRQYCDENGNIIPEVMQELDTAIGFANKHGLVVFLDFHGWYYLNTYREGDLPLYQNIWRSMAEHFKDYEYNDMLIFELINEPHDTEGSNLSLKYLEMLQCDTADIIREINPNRTICFATPDSNEPTTLNALENAYDYRETRMMEYDNIIIAVHVYHPAIWNLQGFEWYGTGNNVVYLDGFYLAELKLALQALTNFKKETGIPVIVGEIGWNTVNCLESDQVRYLEFVLKYLNESGVPMTWWAYNDDKFALYRMGKGFKYQWNDLLVDMMMDY